MSNQSDLADQYDYVIKNPLEYINSVSSDDVKLIFNDNSEESRNTAIPFGIASLLCFVIENVTGPSID